MASVAEATHIVGGEITYQCLGNNQYEITLTVYRDCFNGVPGFDNPAYVGIYDANWTLRQNLSLFWNGLDDTLDVYLNNPCLTIPPNVCVHRSSYTRIITLPVAPGGYTLVYQRCCRNKLIRNIPDPLNTGISIVAEISEEALTQCNNGAVFNNWPPLAICVNQPVDFDHSATDADGDSLVYRLCTPLNGPDSLMPLPNPPFAGPYEELTWTDPPYSLANILGGDPLTIDPATGFMTGIPNTIGNFVVGVCVDEYRDGAVISTTRRDFQYNVADCGQPVAAFFTPELFCDTLGVRFINESLSATFYRWYFDFGVDPSKTSVAFSPFFTYPDTGRYVVALIADPTDPCRDTVFQEIYLTQTYAAADLNFSFPDCDTSGMLVQGFDQSVDPVFGITAWEWILTGPGNLMLESMEQMPEFTVYEAGDYQLQLVATGGNGCKDSTTLEFYAPVVRLDSLQEAYSICAGDTIALFPAADPGYQYAWSPAATLSDPQSPNPLAFPLETTVYSLTLSDPNGPCVLDGQVEVAVLNPGNLAVEVQPDLIYEGENAQLLATFPGATSFRWEPAGSLSNPDIPNPVASPLETTTYTVTAFLSSGCTASAQVTLRVLSPFCDEPYLFFPTGFSPNGDGENDVLKLEGRYIESVYWAVYNRWGEKVFEADSVDDAWDGRHNGTEQPVETYGYYLRVNCPDGQVFERKGNVTLLR